MLKFNWKPQNFEKSWNSSLRWGHFTSLLATNATTEKILAVCGITECFTPLKNCWGMPGRPRWAMEPWLLVPLVVALLHLQIWALCCWADLADVVIWRSVRWTSNTAKTHQKRISFWITGSANRFYAWKKNHPMVIHDILIQTFGSETRVTSGNQWYRKIYIGCGSCQLAKGNSKMIRLADLLTVFGCFLDEDIWDDGPPFFFGGGIPQLRLSITWKGACPNTPTQVPRFFHPFGNMETPRHPCRFGGFIYQQNLANKERL